jgi:peptide/nickel transport system substrate-binding protein
MPDLPRGRCSRRTLLARGAAASAAVAVAAGSPGALRSTLARAAAQQGTGSLVVGTVGDFLNLDPFVMSFVNYPHQETAYDQLMRLDHEVKPQPALAESWSWSEDALALTLNLRQGVTFHSGRPLTAADVVKNFERAAVKETGGNLYSFLPKFKAVEAVDDATVRLSLNQPCAYLEPVLGLLSIVDPEGFEALKSEAAGTGPFKLQEWVPGDHATFVRNDAYWDASRPMVDEVTYRFYADPSSLVAALEGGLLDVIIDVPGVDFERLGSSYQMLRGQEAARFYFLCLNTTMAPFDNKQVRQAIGYAIDRASMVSNVLFDIGTPIVSPYPPFSPAYDEADSALYPYDLERTKQLLTEAGFADGIEFTVVTPNGFPQLGQFAQILQADLESIGSKMNIEPMDNAQWYPVLNGGTYQSTFSFAGGSQMYPTRIAGSSMFAPVDNTVWANGAPPAAYVDAMNEADTSLDPAAQKTALRAMTQAFLDEAWAHPIAFKYTIFGSTNQVSGVDHGVYDQVRVDTATKQ